MVLYLKRWQFGDSYIIGKLYVDNVFQCYTLEDIEREEKVYGKTAIPRGTYKVILDMSTRWKRIMPHILNVSNFEGVRIHSGNTSLDTDGCILVGEEWKGGDFIGKSKLAYNALMKKLEKGVADGVVILTIE